jgi:uncharacterized membrane protein YjjB (DUF3815 family)
MVEAHEMELAIVLAVLLLFFGGCAVAVFFTVKKKGWLVAIRFGLLGFLVTVLLFDTEQTRMKFAVPLFGAVVIAWIWPSIVKQRMSDKNQDRELNLHDENSGEDSK